MAARKLTPFEMAVAGAIGGVVAGGIVYPLDTIKTRIQTEIQTVKQATSTTTTTGLPPSSSARSIALGSPKGPGVRKMLVKILKEQGVAGLYRGFGANMLNTFSMQFAYFYWYTIVRRTYVKRFAPTALVLNTVTELVLGALAAAFAQLFTIPVSVIAVRQQLSNVPTSFASTLRSILADDGITGLWRGLKPSLVLTVNPAITYGMFERLKGVLVKEGEKMGPGKAFYVGAMSKTLATVVTYPYIMAKTRLQAKYDEPQVIDSVQGEDPSYAEVAALPPKKKKKERYSGAVDCLTQVYKEKGLVGWYQGMQAQITKAVLSQALLFGIKDILEAYTLIALIYLAKARAGVVA